MFKKCNCFANASGNPKTIRTPVSTRVKPAEATAAAAFFIRFNHPQKFHIFYLQKWTFKNDFLFQNVMLMGDQPWF